MILPPLGCYLCVSVPRFVVDVGCGMCSLSDEYMPLAFTPAAELVLLRFRSLDLHSTGAPAGSRKCAH